jgi:predicted TIM-barrel fold metal-dependent hydrolase
MNQPIALHEGRAQAFIIDVHTHIGYTSGFRAYFATVDDFVSLMDDTRTELSIVISMPLLARQFELGYHEVTEALRKYPDRLRAYTVFDPNWSEVTLKLIRNFQPKPGFVGIKIHPAIHAVAPEDPRYDSLWAYAEEHHLVVLTHSWSPDPAKPTQNLSTPERFATVLEKHPNLRLILGHAGGREIGRRMAVDLMKTYRNCWVDISGDSFTLGQIESLVEEAGIDRILYGTDSNWIEPRYHLGHVLKSALSAEDRLQIFRLNALEVFGGKLNRLCLQP